MQNKRYILTYSYIKNNNNNNKLNDNNTTINNNNNNNNVDNNNNQRPFCTYCDALQAKKLKRGPQNHHYMRMLDLKGSPCLSCCLLLGLGRVEVFLNSTISPPILSYVIGAFHLCDKLRFRDIIKNFLE